VAWLPSVFERQDLGLVEFEEPQSGRPLKSERTGVQTSAKQHHLAAACCCGHEGKVVVEASANSNGDFELRLKLRE
jgi:hypothetical protein